MSAVLPERPNLTHLKSQAKDLLTAFVTGDAPAIDRVLPYFPTPADFGLNEAQLVIAREYGFDSWAKLKQFVELRIAAGSREEEADSFAAIATQGDSGAVLTRLREMPELSAATLSAACVTGNVLAVNQFLTNNPEIVRQKIGKKNWEPLLYVCYSCLLKEPGHRAGLVETAKQLIAAGADPNAYWLNAEWGYCPEPCLYGATGVNNCPELAELLLKAGAIPNDNESLYHSTELPDWTCLKLLLDHGAHVAHGNGLARLLDREKPDWVRMMLGYAKSPSDIPPVFPHALRRGREIASFAALIESGMNLNTKDANNLTPYQSAIRMGRRDVADLLAAAGADTMLSAADELMGRLSNNESVSPDAISRDVIDLLDREPEPELVRQAERGNVATVATLLAAGANPNVRDSQTTPLHQASIAGREEIVRLLIQYGGDPNLQDTVHQGNALGWLCHGSAHTHDSTIDPDVYVRIAQILIDAGATLPETAWGSEGVQALLIARGAKAP